MRVRRTDNVYCPFAWHTSQRGSVPALRPLIPSPTVFLSDHSGNHPRSARSHKLSEVFDLLDRATRFSPLLAGFEVGVDLAALLFES